jgi:hypothetical protein
MTLQYEFETVETARGSYPGRVPLLSAKRDAQSEVRKQREIEAKKRTAMRLRTVIADFERETANLDVSISSELAFARVRDPSHFAYPISARMMQARRENLKATVAALSERLALTDLPEDDPTSREIRQTQNLSEARQDG